MVELQRRSPEPPELVVYRENHPGDPVIVFESQEFHALKIEIKAKLNEDQGGLCAYCEQKLPPNEGQVEHVLPKRGANGRPDLALHYDNWVHGCIHPKHCGQKKADNLLPIEPAPGCNDHFILLDDGSINPVAGLTFAQELPVIMSLDILGQNHPVLKQDRSKWVATIKIIITNSPENLDGFLTDKPFRHILKTYARTEVHP